VTKKKKSSKAKANGKPWFITTTCRAKLVHKGDRSLEKFPESSELVAPLEECKIKAGEQATLFHVRSLSRQERIKLQAVMAQSVVDGNSGSQIVLLIDEAARLAVEKVELPSGETWTNEEWQEAYEDIDGGLAGALGTWIVQETHKDPLA
jgi:hypothetical protein